MRTNPLGRFKKALLIGGGVLGLLVAIIVVVTMVFDALVAAQVAQEWQTTRVEKIENLGTTHTLEILPLFEEAVARNDLEPEHGVSYLVKTDHQNILLDVGTTPARLWRNMKQMGITERDFDVVFITHIHPDHVGGMDAWWSKTLVAGDPALDLQGKRVYAPAMLNNTNFETIAVNQPTKIGEGIASIGTISFPELFPLSLKTALNSEQTLAVNVAGKGIVLITGCGHPTIERIVTRARALFDEPIAGIVGGLHYEGLDRAQTQPHLEFVKTLDPQLIGVSPHDSSKAAIDTFREAFPKVYQEVQVGRVISFDNTQAMR